MATLPVVRPTRPPARALRGVGLVVTLLLTACSGGEDAAERPRPAGELVDPSGLTAEQVDGLTSCRQLHDAAITWLDTAAARAQELQGDGDALDVMVESMISTEGPLPGLEALEGLLPAAPYGGVAGPVAIERYEELRCDPVAELRRILEWFELPESTPLSVEEDSPLAEALDARLDELGAGGFVAIGLGRRLVEGVALPGSPLMEALADVAQAQEAHRAATGTYASDLETLVPHLDDPSIAAGDDPDRPVVIVTAADADAYCVHGADGPSAVVESHDGIPRPRVPGTPSCPNTFPDIDDR